MHVAAFTSLSTDFLKHSWLQPCAQYSPAKGIIFQISMLTPTVAVLAPGAPALSAGGRDKGEVVCTALGRGLVNSAYFITTAILMLQETYIMKS